MTSSLAQAAARGTLFMMLAQIARIVLQLVSVVVLARLLTPRDYGLLAIVLVIIGLGEIFRDFGLSSASIQAPTLSRGERDNLFWLNTLIGAILTGLMFASSWLVGAVTGEPDIVGMVQWLSLTFLMNGLATQYRAGLMRAVRLKAVAVVDVASAAIALVLAIAAAAGGMGYWALVVQQLAQGALLLSGVVVASRWLPRWYDRAVKIRSFVTLGWNLAASNLVQYASRQVDTVLIAAQLGTTPLGLYNRAHQVVMTPLGQIRAPLQSVALPVLSRVQEDRPRFNTYVHAAQLALGYTLCLPLAIAAGLAEPIVAVMLGEQWSEASPIVRCFAIAGIFTTLAYVGYWVYVSRGLGAALLRYTFVTAALKVVCIVIGSFFGLIGIAIAFAVHPAIAWPISLWWLSRATELPVRALYAGAARILGLSLFAAGCAWLAGIAASGTGVIGSIGLGLAAGLGASALALLLPIYRRDAKTLFGFVRLMVTRRSSS